MSVTMLLTITNFAEPATDLGFLLHKHPERCQSFELAFSAARVFYPEASETRCTAALLLDIDPIALTRGRQHGRGNSDTALFDSYVNDRPYVVSSFMSVAIAQVFGSALAGRSAGRAALVETALPLQATLTPLPCRGGADLPRKLFEPLGYAVSATSHPLDAHEPEWGDSPYYTVTLNGQVRLQDLLAHLYVLIPVLDDAKHYWVGEDEVQKLLRRGEHWLATHPERELIVQRYLRHRRSLTKSALARIVTEEEIEPEVQEVERDAEERVVEETINLHQQRLGAVQAALRASGARRVVDLGCGEGRLLEMLARDTVFTEIVGLDASSRALDRAQRRLDRLAPRQRDKVRLLHGALTYRDQRLAGFDAAALVEVIEHLEPSRLPAFERALFAFARPNAIVLTTPNREYNVRFASLPAGRLRHRDHRFEWTRAELRAWAERMAEQHGYEVRFLGIGPDDPEVGSPSQMALFSLREEGA
jgi:3' terminal RNA ribose 2'-O-methyltransferase Hen1